MTSADACSDSDPSRVPANREILIVDDVPDNLRVLSDILEAEGYLVRKAINGPLAIQSARLAPPALFLLDINMPGMDGYSVCQRLKAYPETADIPVIFISALHEVSNKVRAFSEGGMDYVTKPFQAEEILARVRIHLQLFDMQQQVAAQMKLLQQQNHILKTEIQERKSIESNLRHAEAKYRSIFENATEGIFQTTPEGQFLAVNPALAAIYGYESPEELVMTVTDISRQLYVDPERRQELNIALMRHGQIDGLESEVRRKDGSRIWICENIRMVCDSQGSCLYYEGTVQDITERRRMALELQQQRLQTERLLENVIPPVIVRRLKQNPGGVADSFEQASVLFADLVSFTRASATIAPTALVELLNQIFSAFDALVDKYGLEKIKTIGDAYMVAAGVPQFRADHLDAIAHLALEMQATIRRFPKPDGRPFELRIGLNTGPVVAGVIGSKKFAYDLWGNTVNIASRMEESSLPGKIQVSEQVYDSLKHRFVFEQRGWIPVPGIGEMKTYFLCHVRQENGAHPVRHSQSLMINDL